MSDDDPTYRPDESEKYSSDESTSRSFNVRKRPYSAMYPHQMKNLQRFSKSAFLDHFQGQNYQMINPMKIWRLHVYASMKRRKGIKSHQGHALFAVKLVVKSYCYCIDAVMKSCLLRNNN